ncbi:mitochondrial inner membrane protein OXA1-like [Euphorbia lathyris]|uniref:mitochondrial inner membrane protein OXA1-like n=1 Tax=Euphorbia lathyris TaxID=212925 RepID=UPI0033138455
MAYIRGLSTRANLLTRRCHASIGYVLHHDDDDSKHDSIPKGPSSQGTSNFLQHRGFVSGFANSSLLGYVKDRRCNDFSLSPTIGIGASFSRHMSTTIGEGTDKIEMLTDVADVLSDTTVQAVASQAPALNEVAIAAADSFFPVAVLQHFIDAVHSFTGLNWWVCIALTTIVIRGAVLPLVVNQLKATSQLTLMRPRLEEIQQKIKDGGLDMYDGNKQMQMLFKEYGVTPFTPMKGLFIQGPIFISFFLAVSNMAEKVPSFKTGGAYWFLDLSTPDTLYILPVLTALTFWITVEYNMQEGLEGNPIAGTMKNVSRGLAVLTVPLTIGFPKAIFCYWVTSNIFSLAYGMALKVPGVKKFLGLPKMPVTPPASSASQPSFSLSSILKQISAAQNPSTASPPVESTSKVPDQRISPNSVMSQRIRSLEKQVKGRKKNKKR